MSDSTDTGSSARFVFPRWSNFIVPGLIIAVIGGLPYIVILVGFGASPVTLNTNYQPEQPIPYSHKLHVTELGMDCRYCHTTVDDTSFAAIPSTSICMNCHHSVRKNAVVQTPDGKTSKTNPKLKPLYKSYEKGTPVRWNKVHDLPDYAYFNHSAHINKGVSCVECHGRVDRMDEAGVYQAKPLNMGWCLECHRKPAENLRPVDQVTNLLWGKNLTEDQVTQLKQEYDVQDVKVGGQLSKAQRKKIGHTQLEKFNIQPRKNLQDCSTCHR